MYHVLGTGLTAVILYTISYVFCRYGIYTLQTHRRIWNIILTIAFLITATSGLFLALQISFKWSIPELRNFLTWHVEAGIGLAFTGIFHFIRHLSYFSHIPEKRGESKKIPEKKEDSIIIADPAVNLFMIGFISSAVQLLFLKELMNISGGYELVVGTYLGTWLIISAAGAALGGKYSVPDLKRTNLIFIFSLAVSVILLVLFARLWLNPGETPSFFHTILLSSVVLLPFCTASGLAFIRLVDAARRKNGYKPGKSYSIETAGGILAGLFVSMLSSGVLNTYQMLLLVLIAAGAYFFLSFYEWNIKEKLAIKMLILVIASGIICSKPDIFFRHILLHGLEVRSSDDTPYGNVTTAEYNGESSIYYNHRLIVYKEDVTEREEDIHYTMLQSDNPENVLIISGSLNTLFPEIKKYPVRKTIYIERDPELARIQRTSVASNEEYLVIENSDAFSYVMNTKERFDVVILLLPSPSSLSLNRFYTIEFFTAVKKILRDEGFFSCSPGINPYYFNDESVKFFSSIFNSLSEVFGHVTPVGGNKLYFIASDKKPVTSFGKMANLKGIENYYVGPDYISDDLVSAKSDEIKSLMDKSIKKNRSAIPVACFYYQSFNLSKSLRNTNPAVYVLIIVFALPLIFIRKTGALMYFTASALAGFEIIILLSLQLIMGNIYQLTGLVTSGLMAGLAVGAGMKRGAPAFGSMVIKIILLMCFYLVIGLTINWHLSLSAGFHIIVIILLFSFIPALITGKLFRDLTFLNTGKNYVSGIYSADLAGSAMGFILFSGLTVPILGIEKSLYIAALLIVASLTALIGNKGNF